MEKVDLPHNSELEKLLLSGVFSQKQEVRAEILTLARPELIYDRNLRAIFVTAAETGSEPAVVYDMAWTRNSRLKEQLPRDEFQTIIDSKVGKDESYTSVIAQLRKLWQRRETMLIAGQILRSDGKGSEDLARQLTDIALHGEVSHYNDNPSECTSEILNVALDGPDRSTREGFGLEVLDGYLRGLRRIDFTVVAAPANVGKTPFVIDAMRKRAEAGLGHQVIFTLEQTKEDITRTLIAQHSGLAMDILLNGADTSERAEVSQMVMESIEWVAENFSIIDPSVGELTRTVFKAIMDRKMAELNAKGKTLDTVMVDYLQILAGDDKDAINGWTMFFKLFAIKSKVPVILISSLNNSYLRRCENASPDDKYVIPSPADLRGSGNIMFDASKVLFLMYVLVNGEPSKKEKRGNRYVYVMKNKFGTPFHLARCNINRCLSYSDGHVV